MCFIQHFLSTLWMPDNSAHLWEEVIMKKNWDPSLAKSLSSHNPFAFHHHGTSFCRMATAGSSKRWPQGPLPSHGSRWTDGGNSVKGTKPTSWIPSFLSGPHPPCHILLFRVSESLNVSPGWGHTLYTCRGQAGDEGVRRPGGASILAFQGECHFPSSDKSTVP